MFALLPNTVCIAHQYLQSKLSLGSTAIDATVGNGNDTLFLARLVGSAGRVYGFDIQGQALEATTALLAEHGLSQTVTLFQSSHENIKDLVSEPVDAVVFNLGYLPGGNHEIVTRPESTVKAVEASLAILKPGGIVCLVVYTGHPTGAEEQEILENYLEDLDKKEFCVAKLDFVNRHKAPYLIVIEKSLKTGQEGSV